MIVPINPNKYHKYNNHNYKYHYYNENIKNNDIYAIHIKVYIYINDFNIHNDIMAYSQTAYTCQTILQ